MHHTLSLLDKALVAAKSERELCRNLGLGETTLAMAKKRGHLSPTVAALVAASLGEDEIYWTAIAGLESDKANPHKARLIRRMLRKSYFQSVKGARRPPRPSRKKVRPLARAHRRIACDDTPKWAAASACVRPRARTGRNS